MKIVSSHLVRALAPLAVLAACSNDAPVRDTTLGAARGAQTVGAAAEPTAIDVSNYELDMDKMRRYALAIKGFSRLSPADTAGLGKIDMGSTSSMSENIAAIEAHPAARRVLAEAGLGAREYVLITAAYLQAAMTQGMLQASSEFTVPEGQSRQNVDFLNANRAEIEVMMRDAGMIH
jgi:hypothetical protein